MTRRIRISYKSDRTCDYGDRIEEEYLDDFVNRNADIGKLVTLLVDAGVLDIHDVFEVFKSWGDYGSNLKVVDD